MMNTPAIELKRLTRYFGKKSVVRDLNLSVPTGKVTALLGLNGAGKTTTIRILMGLLAPTRGQAITLGEDASNLSANARARIGYLVEGHFLYPSMKVRDCESFQRAGYKNWNDEMFLSIVSHFGIEPSARISTLSRGQRAGVSLALLLAPDPELLVLDDPALGLDPVSRRALNETLVEFASGGKRTVLLSTHLLDDVERIADRVAVMVAGRLKVDTGIDDFVSRVSTFALATGKVDSGEHGEQIATQLATIPGLIEARQLGNRLRVTIADANGVAHQAIEKIAVDGFESVDTTFSDTVLSYLTRERGDGPFLNMSSKLRASK